MGENTQCLFFPVQALISGWEKQQPVTFQLFHVCLCMCERWIHRTVCLESFRSSGQVPQNPIGISGAWRRDPAPLPCGSLKGVFAGHGAGPAGDRVLSWWHSPAGSALLPFCLEETERQH